MQWIWESINARKTHVGRARPTAVAVLVGLVAVSTWVACPAEEERWIACTVCIPKVDLEGPWRVEIELLPEDPRSLEPPCALPGSGETIEWQINQGSLWARISLPDSKALPLADEAQKLDLVGAWNVHHSYQRFKDPGLKAGECNGLSVDDDPVPWLERPALFVFWDAGIGASLETITSAIGDGSELQSVGFYNSDLHQAHPPIIEKTDRGEVTRITVVTMWTAWRSGEGALSREASADLLGQLGCPAWLIQRGSEDHVYFGFLIRHTFTRLRTEN